MSQSVRDQHESSERVSGVLKYQALTQCQRTGANKKPDVWSRQNRNRYVSD